MKIIKSKLVEIENLFFKLKSADLLLGLTILCESSKKDYRLHNYLNRISFS